MKISEAKYEAKKIIRDFCFWAIAFCLCILTSAIEAEEIPPIPQGYANELLVQAAILSGQLKLIDAENVSVPDGVEEILDIEYGTGGERKLLLDLYLPKDRTKIPPRHHLHSWRRLGKWQTQ